MKDARIELRSEDNNILWKNDILSDEEYWKQIVENLKTRFSYHGVSWRDKATGHQFAIFFSGAHGMGKSWPSSIRDKLS